MPDIPDYRKLYLHLFNQLTTILECINRGNFFLAKQLIIQAQAEAEEMYIADE